MNGGGPVVQLVSHVAASRLTKAQGVGACLALGVATVTVVQEFLEWCRERGYSPDTIKLYRWTLNRWVLWVGDPLTATADDVRAWLATFSGHSASTRSSYRGILASLYRWAHEWAELIDRNPMLKVPSPKLPKRKPRPITMAQYETVLGSAEGRMLCWLLLGGEAGLRRAEIATLERAALIDRRLYVIGKGDKARVVPVTARLGAALERWPERGRLWDVTPHHLGTLVSKHMHAVGVDASLHQLRHLAGSRFFRASGGDLLRTQAFLGHGQPTTTVGYCAWDDDLDEIVDRMAA
jgi:integrase/recombinase XerD